MVYFKDPIYSRPVVKRCIGVERTPVVYGDDAIQIGTTLLSVEEFTEPVLKKIRSIPKGSIFVVGENRAVSIDSRHYGPVDENSVLGRVIWQD